MNLSRRTFAAVVTMLAAGVPIAVRALASQPAEAHQALAPGRSHAGPSHEGSVESPMEADSDRAARIEQILRAWDSIEDHRTGSPGDRQTAEWLAAQLRAAGVAARLDGFPFRRRIVREAWLEVDGTRIDGLPCFDGGATGTPIEAALTPLSSGSGIGVGVFSASALDAETRALGAARSGNAHDALIAISSGQDGHPGLAVINAEDYARPLAMPVLQVASGHREWLEAAVASGRRGRVQITFDEEATEAFNIQVEIPGRDSALAPIVVMTPRSSWWVSTSERGGGIVVWLEAARMFAAAAPLRTVYFTANTGHELGHIGLDRWLARDGHLLGAASAWIHLGANFAARDGQIRFQASSEDLLARGQAALAAEGIAPDQVTPVGTRPLGEARNVFDGNGRYVSLLGTNPWFHHPDDRWPGAIDLPKTVALTRAMLSLIERLANAPHV